MRIACLLVLAAGCGQLPDINVFTVEDDIELGQQVRDEIAADPETYPLLDPAEFPEAYDHLYRVREALLESDDFEYKDEFEWEMHIIHDDETLNAFCAPGGYIYVYTGILKYLDEEDHFAGVLGHEMAHADRRHSTDQLTKLYGISTLLGIALGKGSKTTGAEIAQALAGLEFSRKDEAEADEYSVRYLCDTDYAADGTAGFFEKIVAEGGVQVPEFLSTHPSSESRVEDIRAFADALGCSTEPNPNATWAEFQASLPR